MVIFYIGWAMESLMLHPFNVFVKVCVSVFCMCVCECVCSRVWVCQYVCECVNLCEGLYTSMNAWSIIWPIKLYFIRRTLYTFTKEF